MRRGGCLSLGFNIGVEYEEEAAYYKLLGFSIGEEYYVRLLTYFVVVWVGSST